MPEQVQEQAQDGDQPDPQAPAVSVVRPRYICVSDGDFRSQAVAERTSGFMLRICSTQQAIINFVEEVGSANVVIMFDAQSPTVTYPVRFHERGMRKVGDRVPSYLLSLGVSYFVEVGRLDSKKSDRTSHVATLFVSIFAKHFAERVSRGEYPWGMKPGTGRKLDKAKKNRGSRGSRWSRENRGTCGIAAPYVHP